MNPQNENPTGNQTPQSPQGDVPAELLVDVVATKRTGDKANPSAASGDTNTQVAAAKDPPDHDIEAIREVIGGLATPSIDTVVDQNDK